MCVVIRLINHLLFANSCQQYLIIPFSWFSKTDVLKALGKICAPHADQVLPQFISIFLPFTLHQAFLKVGEHILFYIFKFKKDIGATIPQNTLFNQLKGNLCLDLVPPRNRLHPGPQTTGPKLFGSLWVFMQFLCVFLFVLVTFSD